ATGETRPYYTSAGVSGLALRPQKGTFTFLSKKSGDETNAVYEINLSGGEATKVFSHSENISNYSWQNDGNRIAFIVNEKGEKPKTTLSYSPNFYEEDFSERKVYIHSVNSNSNPEVLKVNGSAYIVSWSPDGSKIAVSAAPTSSVDDSFMNQQVF